MLSFLLAVDAATATANVLSGNSASDNGWAGFYISGAAGNTLTGKTHVAIAAEAAQEMVSVPAVTLDSFWQEIGEKRVAFIKCDIEGFELFALRGARKLIESCRPVFYNELNTEWCERYDYTPADIFSFFQRYEYSAFYLDVEKGLVSVDVDKHVNRDVLFSFPKNPVGAAS